MAAVNESDWRPRGIEDLEPNAWEAIRRTGNTCVVAGPGAGKTEFLAQRATYLLETGLCRRPYRILAISFKTDAAENLARRVRERCSPENADRFVSLTFDAFTKGLVDRFHSAIPPAWRPTKPYEITFPHRREVDDFLTRTRFSAPRNWQAQVVELSPTDFESRVVGSTRLEEEPQPPTSGIELAIQHWWKENLQQQGGSHLTFIMLNRLAELLLRANTQIARALRTTYRFVFIDEFQDTTYAQYDFVLSALRDPKITVTAVGDDKQRIMAWAGARTDSFIRFESDFQAKRIPLLFNFRSSPDLVRIQHVVAQALDATTVPTIAQAKRKIDGDVAQVWNCPTEEREGEQIAKWLAADISTRGTAPRDYAILVRQTADRFEEQLTEPLALSNLRVRNESRVLGRTTLQDLLVEEFTFMAIAILRLGVIRRSAQAWQRVSAAVQQLRAVDPEDLIGCRRAERDLITFLKQLRTSMSRDLPSSASAQALTTRIVAFLDQGALARSYLEYSTGEKLAIAIEAFQLHLANSAEGAANWTVCLDRFEGIDQIPLMTVHKSKGLEYDTVLFVGLDDQMWWSYSPRNPEGIATFFVALSRAKQRAIFTFCRARGERTRVADLYQLLRTAGVPEVAV
jgi:superfamily I DNA/RNA helicase